MPASPIAAALRFLKEAAANLADAHDALAGADPASSTRIDQLLQGVSSEIRQLEALLAAKS